MTAPRCPRCGAVMKADRQITVCTSAMFGRPCPPPRPIWLCWSCSMRIDREEGGLP